MKRELPAAARGVVAETKIDDLLSTRAELGRRLTELLRPSAEALGLTLRAAEVKDVMFPGALKKIFAEVVRAQKEGQAALERARGETAALRNLANAAKMLEDNPALFNLRMLQAISSPAGAAGNSIVLGMPSGVMPINGSKEREAMTGQLILIDGSQGEGGGQILRTSLALSLVTGKPFRIQKIRAGRAKPGLLRQHLTAVHAAAQVSDAEVSGAETGSRDLTFAPGRVRGGEYHFAVGTAGSATLVLQTVLPALCLAAEPSRLLLEGGTHNPFAPPWDFLARAFLPLLGRMGPVVTTELERYGFYPAGGGRMKALVTPVAGLVPLVLLERGEIRQRRARALAANLPTRIAEREVAILQSGFGLLQEECRAQGVRDSAGPGNVITVEIEAEHVTEVFTGFGQRGVKAEDVAASVGREMQRYLEAGAPVGEHLADQLLVPLALAGGGRFRTVEPSSHCTTNLEVIQHFVAITTRVERIADSFYEIELGGSR